MKVEIHPYSGGMTVVVVPQALIFMGNRELNLNWIKWGRPMVYPGDGQRSVPRFFYEWIIQ